jgi:hypothetical protein
MKRIGREKVNIRSDESKSICVLPLTIFLSNGREKLKIFLRG